MEKNRPKQDATLDKEVAAGPATKHQDSDPSILTAEEIQTAIDHINTYQGPFRFTISASTTGGPLISSSQSDHPRRASSLPTRPFSDLFLQAYSDEHLRYEVEMFGWLAALLSKGSLDVSCANERDAVRYNNALIESFVVHLRNLIDFLYPALSMKETDVVAADFFVGDTWNRLCPAISKSLGAARTRAHKEIAHLTSDRSRVGESSKPWDFQALASELSPLLRAFCNDAMPQRLSPSVKATLD